MPRNHFSDVHIFLFSFYIVSQIKDSDSMFSRPQAYDILLENMEYDRFSQNLKNCTNLSFFFLQLINWTSIKRFSLGGLTYILQK